MHRIWFFARSLLPTALLAAIPTLHTAPVVHGVVRAGTMTTRAASAAEVLAQAAPDECFAGVGQPYPPGPPCQTGQPKVNQSYVWGLAKAGDGVWFGTAANVQCLTLGTSLGQTTATQNDDYVCEYGQSQLRKRLPILPAAAGDWRPPKVYVYQTSTRTLTDKTGDITRASGTDSARLNSTVGIRAAGSYNGVVLLGGPALTGVNLFAFDAASGKYLGSTSLGKYGNIRHFLVADGALYVGMGVGPDGQGGGAVLRWSGDKSSPFKFTAVADIPAQVADLAVHQGRIFVSTWPSIARGFSARSAAGVWMSPPLADGQPGLTADDAKSWTQVWNVTEYEPDPVIAKTYGMGALASYGGYLYWGTMHVPLKATQTMATLYGKGSTPEAGIQLVENTQRTASIFRAGGNFGGGRAAVELLYGESQLPKYNPLANSGKGAWTSAPTGYTPKYGHSGFGNPYNNYTWTMTVAGGSLYVGTMDWGYISQYSPANVLPWVQAELGTQTKDGDGGYGADLYAFDSPQGQARKVDDTGLGNSLNYGIRTMLADGTSLYLGMANPMNLRTDPKGQHGGWELLRLQTAAVG